MDIPAPKAAGIVEAAARGHAERTANYPGHPLAGALAVYPGFASLTGLRASPRHDLRLTPPPSGWFGTPNQPRPTSQ
jgi:hypothetical protein